MEPSDKSFVLNESQPSDRFSGRCSTSPDLVSLSSSSSIESERHFIEDGHHFAETSDSIESDPVLLNLAPNSDPNSYGRIADRSIELVEGHSEDLRHSVQSTGSSSFHQSTGADCADKTESVDSCSYQLLDKDKLTVPDYESAGLLYARSSKEKYDMDLSPADEIAVEVGYEESLEEDDEDRHLQPTQIRHVRDLVMENPTLQTGDRWIAPIDPGALLEMETSAKLMATDLAHVMDNLRNSLHAMTVCTKQSIQLHRESIDNLHTVVDGNVKGMYTLMAKSEELYKCLAPMKQIANQISEMDENLKRLELTFAKSQ